MIMAEVLNSPPACYNCSRPHAFRICCSAYFNLGFKTKINCAKNHGFSVVALLEGSRASLETAKQRIPQTLLVYKSSKSRNSCVMPNKVASLEFEAACEEERKWEGEGGLNENGSQKMLPPWGDSAGDEDFDDQNNLNRHSKVSKTNDDRNNVDYHSRTSKAIGGTEVEIYYLEERDEEILSQRMLKLSRSNKVRSALALYKSMEISGLLPNPHACNSFVTCLLRNKRLDEALRVFEFMKSNEIVTGHTYSLILKAVANSWSHEAALSMFEEAERDERAKKYMDTIVYNTMIAVFVKVDDWVRINRIWESLKDNGLVGTEVTYRLLVCTFVRCCQNELALDAYHEMLRNGISPDDDAMEAVIGACTREGRWDMALDVLETMMNGDRKPSLIACNALINSLGKGAKVELSFKVYDLMKSLGYTPDAYTWNGLLCALNRANKHGDAIRLFESIRKQHKSVMNVHIYNTCLMSCQRLGLWEKAMKVLWEMEGSGFPVSVTSYNLVIGACEAARKPKVALQVYDHMVRLKQCPDVFTRLSLIRSCIWGSLWDEVDEILNVAPNGSLYNAAIQGASLRGKACLARKLYTKMREIGLTPDGKTRALMLQNLPKG